MTGVSEMRQQPPGISYGSDRKRHRVLVAGIVHTRAVDPSVSYLVVEDLVAMVFLAGLGWGLYLVFARPERFFAPDE